MYSVTSLSNAELKELKEKVDKEYKQREKIKNNKLSKIEDLLREMEKDEEAEEATLIYYENINPQFLHAYKNHSHWSTRRAELSKEGMQDLCEKYSYDDVFRFGNHVYVLFDKGKDTDTTGGLFQGQIMAYYRKFKLKKVKI